MNTILLFALCTAVNVILSTIKSILTVNGGKFSASLINAITYGFYSYVIVLTSADGMPIWLKMAITAVCNFVGVYFVKWIEEKARKEKLWKVEFAVPASYNADIVKLMVTDHDIPCNYFYAGKWIMFNCYCSTQEQTRAVKEIAHNCNGKISAYESKNLE